MKSDVTLNVQFFRDVKRHTRATAIFVLYCSKHCFDHFSLAYLITVGTALWLGAHSAGWVLAGQIVLALSVLPVGVWIYQWIEEWRFVQYQKKLDLESEGLSESTHLLHTV